MTLILDAATEQRLQQEPAAGRFREPSDLIARSSGFSQDTGQPRESPLPSVGEQGKIRESPQVHCLSLRDALFASRRVENISLIIPKWMSEFEAFLALSDNTLRASPLQKENRYENLLLLAPSFELVLLPADLLPECCNSNGLGCTTDTSV
jgi:hypothetical protein